MSKKIGQPARHAQAHARATSKGILIATSAAAAVAVVGVAYTMTATPPGAAVAASFISVQTPASTHGRLTAAGLNSLLHARLGTVRAAIADQGSTAAQQAGSALTSGTGQLSPDGTTITVNTPALANIDGSVGAALAPISSQMGELGGSNGQLAKSVSGNLVGISPLLNLTGPHATVTASAPIDLDAAVAPTVDGTQTAGAVTLNPQAGTATIDLSRLLGGAGTGTGSTSASSLTPAQIAEIEADINSASGTMGTNAVNAATTSVENTPVNVDANVKLVTTPTSSGSGSCSAANGSSTSATTGGLLTGAIGGTVNGLLGGGIGKTVNGLLCSLPTQLLPSLLTTLGLDSSGTVGQLVEGTAPPATGSATVLGSPTPINFGDIDSGIGSTLVNNFGGTTGSGNSASGSGSGPASGSGTSAGSGDLGLGLNVNGGPSGSGVDVGGLGLGLGGLGTGGLGLGGLGLGGLGLGTGDLGGLTGSTGSGATGITPGVLGSLLTDGSNLPIGISAAGNGVGSATVGSAAPSGSDLLNLNGATNGVNGSARVGTPSSSGSSDTSNQGSLISLGL